MTMPSTSSIADNISARSSAGINGRPAPFNFRTPSSEFTATISFRQAPSLPASSGYAPRAAGQSSHWLARSVRPIVANLSQLPVASRANEPFACRLMRSPVRRRVLLNRSEQLFGGYGCGAAFHYDQAARKFANCAAVFASAPAASDAVKVAMTVSPRRLHPPPGRSRKWE